MNRKYFMRVMSVAALCVMGLSLSACSGSSYYDDIALTASSVDDVSVELDEKTALGAIPAEATAKSQMCVQKAHDATLLAVGQVTPSDSSKVDVEKIQEFLSLADSYVADTRAIIGGDEDIECDDGG